MKFLYKVWSNYDGFTPAEIPARQLPGGLLRLGWARYIVPSTLTTGLDILGSVDYPGFDATSNTIAPLQGVPQQKLADPFPGGHGRRSQQTDGVRLPRRSHVVHGKQGLRHGCQVGIRDRIRQPGEPAASVGQSATPFSAIKR